MISTSPAYDTQRFITVLQTEHALFRLVLPIADYHSISSTSEVIPVGAALIYASFTNDDSLVVVSDDCRFCTHFRNEDVVRAINMKDSPRAGFGWERLEDDHQDNNLFSLLPPQGEMFMNSLACFSRNPESGLM